MQHVENCYGCGKGNPAGLKMTFTVHDDHIVGTLATDKNHAGPPQVVHGGVIAAAVDESFSVLVRQALKQDARTVRLKITYRQAAALGETLSVLARPKEETRKTFIVTAEVSVNDQVVAEAEAMMFKWLPRESS